jgi:hypothetical protein
MWSGRYKRKDEFSAKKNQPDQPAHQSIDNCKHTFVEMATTVLPAYMEEMRLAMTNPHSFSSLCTRGLGLKGVLSKLGRTEACRAVTCLFTTDDPSMWVSLGPWFNGCVSI